MKKMKKKYFIVCCLSVLAGSVFAQSRSTASPFKFLNVPNGDRIIVPASDTRQAQQGQQIWNQAFSNTVPGSVQTGRNFYTPGSQGVDVAHTATGRLPPAQVAAAVARAAAKVITPISIGIAIYDLAKELGFNASNNPAGGIAVTQTPSGFDGFEYFGKHSVSYSTQAAACSSFNSTSNPDSQGRFRTSTYTKGSTTSSCLATLVDQPAGEVFYSGEIDIVSRGSPIAPPPPTPVPVQNFIDAVAAKSGWPAASRVNDVVLDDPNPELQKPDQIVVSGPASSPGPKSTTVNNTNNTTTTNNTTNNYNYEGDTLKTTVVTTSVTVDNSTGAVTRNETTTATPPPPAPKPSITCGLPDTPACKLDETGTPTGKDAFQLPKSELDTAKSSIETAIGGAAQIPAPAWTFAFQLPTGCAPYVTGIKGVVLNVCQYQDTIHGLLSAIWAAATAFAMIGMVGRTIRES